MGILGSAFSLFLVYNTLGMLPFYIATLSSFSPKRQKAILIREMLIALFILLLFGFCGDSVLKFLGITGHIMSISGGILLFLISLTLIFPKDNEPINPTKQEPLIVPIAIPTMAGPGTIAAVMLYANQFDDPWKTSAVIFLAWIPSLIIVLSATSIRHIVGEKGLAAFQRLGGLLISLVAVQMITSGIINLVKESFHLKTTEAAPLNPSPLKK
jgi:multiple antibiotic resistance protein